MKKQIWVLTCLATWISLAACTTKQPPLTPHQEATLDKLTKLFESAAQVEQMAKEQQQAVLAGDTSRARLLKRLRDELVELYITQEVLIGEFGKSADPLGIFLEARPTGVTLADIQAERARRRNLGRPGGPPHDPLGLFREDRPSGTVRVPLRRPGETYHQYLVRTENPTTSYPNQPDRTQEDSARYDASQKSFTEIATDESLSLWKKPLIMAWRIYKGPPKKISLIEIATDKNLSLGEKHRLMARKIEEIQADAIRRLHEQPEPDENR